MGTNEHIIKVKGSACISEPLINGRDYIIGLTGQVVSTTEKDNQDGTSDLIYSIQIETLEVVKDNGESIKSKDKAKSSQKLRSALWIEHQNRGVALDFDDYYERVVKKMIAFLPDILDLLNKK